VPIMLQPSCRARAAAVAVLAVLCTGCAALLGGKTHEPVAIYVLQVDTDAPPQGTPPCGTLEVTEPAPAPGFATARMVYQREAHRLEPYAYARWAEPPSAMVQAALISTLEHSGLFAAVLTAPAAVAPDLRLESDALSVLQHFDGGSSELRLALAVRLVDLRESRLLAVQRFTVSLPAGQGPVSGVDAANRALAQLAGELLDLTRRSTHCDAP
jgi:cholesterol transport system auxiliary component